MARVDAERVHRAQNMRALRVTQRKLRRTSPLRWQDVTGALKKGNGVIVSVF